MKCDLLKWYMNCGYKLNCFCSLNDCGSSFLYLQLNQIKLLSKSRSKPYQRSIKPNFYSINHTISKPPKALRFRPSTRRIGPSTRRLLPNQIPVSNRIDYFNLRISSKRSWLWPSFCRTSVYTRFKTANAPLCSCLPLWTAGPNPRKTRPSNICQGRPCTKTWFALRRVLVQPPFSCCSSSNWSAGRPRLEFSALSTQRRRFSLQIPFLNFDSHLYRKFSCKFLWKYSNWNFRSLQLLRQFFRKAISFPAAQISPSWRRKCRSLNLLWKRAVSALDNTL